MNYFFLLFFLIDFGEYLILECVFNYNKNYSFLMIKRGTLYFNVI